MRRPRGKKSKQVDLVLFNSSGSRQLGNAMTHYGKLRGCQGEASVAAIICQEHHLRGDGWVDFKHKSKKHGWAVKGAQAIECEKGSRAGVCIAVSTCFDSGARLDEPSDPLQEIPCAAGRLTSVWIDGIIRGGLLVLSMYLWHSEGLSSRNWQILLEAGGVIAKHGGPWIIGAEFNMPEKQLGEAERWLRRIGGVIRAPSIPTCRSINGGRVIDYVVIDQRIAAALQVWTDVSFPGSPHSPVVLRLSAVESRRRALFLKRPKPLPLDRPAGCLAKEGERACQVTLDMAIEATAEQRVPLDAALGETLRVAEAEWCDIAGFDIPRQQRCVGRGRAPVLKMLPVIPPMPGQGMSRTDDVGLGLNLLLNCWNEMVGILSRSRSTGYVSQAARKRWAAITVQMRSPSGLIAFAAECDSRWRWKCVSAGLLVAEDFGAIEVLKCVAAEAKTSLQERCKRLSSTARSSWKEWVEEQWQIGAVALHRFTRREDIAPETIIYCPYLPSLALEDRLHAAKEEWAAIWLRFQGVAEAHWRKCPEQLLERSAVLPPLIAQMLRDAAKTFKRRTGLRCDSIHPRSVGWLSDAALALLRS